MIIGVIILIWWGRLWANVLSDLPNINEIEEFKFKQATVITDRNGEVLYKLFEENRDYVPYEDISHYFVDAIIATEDQRFWDNPWVDWKGTIRAWITDLRYGKSQGWSTITQQLIKNMLLTSEKKLERKLKEIILAMKLSGYIKKDVDKRYNNLSKAETDKKVKEKILELYSNYIFLGNNSYGIETASQTYFAKKAADLTILEAAVLAGIPQAPSRYDPYTNREIVMGALHVTDGDGTPVEMTDELHQAILAKIKTSIDGTNIAFKKQDSAIIDFFKGLLSFKINVADQTYQVDYVSGRKDTVLARMYEESYITESEFKQSFFEGLTYEFRRGKVQINAPHFVFWIIKLLEENYDPEILREGGLTIKTSLDYQIQKLAEMSIEENEFSLANAHANNTAMIYLDSQNGDVLAYVGSKDYYNDDIDGQVDIIQSQRQPGSSIKPLLYALGFMTLPLTIDTPMYDIPFVIWNDRPENADGTYLGLTALKNALAWSRNIPAIKMFFAVGGEKVFTEFLNKLGIKSVQTWWDYYGRPIAIGAAEMQLLELATAYTHLSAFGKPAVVNPLLEVRAADGSILYKKQVQVADQVIPSGVAYLIWNILSDGANMPAAWLPTFTYPGIKFAVKTWTTNVKKGDQKLPRDGWLVTYTPSKVLAFWAGNTDGSALRADAYGGWISSPTWKTFITKLKEKGLIQNETASEREVKSVTISKVSGKLASFDTPLALSQKTLAYTNTVPLQVDENITKIQVDMLCNGLPSELTPPQDLSDAYLIKPETFLPDQRDQADIIERWKTKGIEKYTAELGLPIYLEELTGACTDRAEIASGGEISLDLVQPKEWQQISRNFSVRHQTKSPFKIKTMKLYLGSIELKSFKYNKEWNLIDISNISIPPEVPAGNYSLKAIVIDEKWYSDSKTVNVQLIDADINAPYLMQDKVQVTKKADNKYDVVILFADNEWIIASGTIKQGDTTLYEFKGNVAYFTVSSLGTISYTVTDNSGNVGNGTWELKE